MLYKEVENPMVLDSLWDEIDEDEIDEDVFGILADMEYDDLEKRESMDWFVWSRENDGYHF